MIVIGIDPGLAIVGYGVLQKDGRKTTAIAYDCIRTSPKGMTTPERLQEIHRRCLALFEAHRPDAVAVEKLFFTRNITSAMSVAEVRGVILLAAAEAGVPVTEYTPNQVKQAVTGSGKAEKIQVQEMIRRLLSLPEIPRPDDVADGLAIALCHLHWVR
jgi:crossover junction endodeoxyribonuclease RuvC